MSSAMVPVWIRHDFKCFDFRIDMLITARFFASRLLYAFSRSFSLRFLPDFFGIMLLGCGASIPGYPRHQYRFVNPFSDTVLIQPEIVDALLLLPYIRYLPVLPVDGHLGFDGMPFLFPRIIRFFWTRYGAFGHASHNTADFLRRSGKDFLSGQFEGFVFAQGVFHPLYTFAYRAFTHPVIVPGSFFKNTTL
jgi:hypothetical protein